MAHAYVLYTDACGSQVSIQKRAFPRASVEYRVHEDVFSLFVFVHDVSQLFFVEGSTAWVFYDEAINATNIIQNYFVHWYV